MLANFVIKIYIAEKFSSTFVLKLLDFLFKKKKTESMFA